MLSGFISPSSASLSLLLLFSRLQMVFFGLWLSSLQNSSGILGSFRVQVAPRTLRRMCAVYIIIAFSWISQALTFQGILARSCEERAQELPLRAEQLLIWSSTCDWSLWPGFGISAVFLLLLPVLLIIILSTHHPNNYFALRVQYQWHLWYFRA